MAAIIDGKDLRFGLRSDVAEKVEKSGLLDLVECCDFLYQQAFYANTELAILFDLKKLPGEYEREVICAPCFFSCARIALADSCFMNCARLFDRDGNVTIGALLKMCASASVEIDARACDVYGKRSGIDGCKSIKHALARDEERFYFRDVERQRRIDNLFGDNRGDAVYVCMSAVELVELWQKRYNSLSKLTGRLRTQRNKVFAHNDAVSLDYESFASMFPLTFGELQQLIDFALDVTIGTLAAVAGDNRPRLPINVEDLRGLLNCVDTGMKAVEQQTVSAFSEL